MSLRTSWRRFAFLNLAAVGVLLISVTAEAKYSGTEPERLVSLLEESEGWEATEDRLAEIETQLGSAPNTQLWNEKGLALAARGRWEEAEAAFRHAQTKLPPARLGLAVSLFQLGRLDEALETIESESERSREDYRFRYLHVLLRLNSGHDIGFSELRKELLPILSGSASHRDVFEVWLNLNPEEDELKSYLNRLKDDPAPDASWQRAEVLLRLHEADDALIELQKAAAVEGELQNRMDYARTRAYFQLKSDKAGQTMYHQILDHLEDETAERLFRDLAAITSPSERAQFEATATEEKGDFFRGFWMKRHPVPVQEVNPRLAEHFRRLAQALREYPLQSAGRGCFTDREVFLTHSPELAHYNPVVLFEMGQTAHYWIDHRGLVLLRQGEPAFKVGPQRRGGSNENESWAIAGTRGRPFVFNFVKRAQIDEFVLVLNLAVAATRPAAADDPLTVLESLTRNYRRLYQSRVRLHPVYRGVFDARSQVDLERGLRAESEQMAVIINAALASDSTSFYTRENTLRMAVSASDFYTEGQAAVDVDFAVDLSVLDLDKLDESSTLEATVLFYDQDWNELYTQVEEEFSLWPPPSGKAKTFVGNIQVLDIDPNQYRLVLQVYQAETGRVGIARGLHETMYVRAENLGLSDLYLRQLPVAAKGKEKREELSPDAPWLPVPARVIRRKVPSKIEFELYNLKADESGLARYEIEERVLTLYKKPGILSQIAGYGNMAGQMFFPLYTFVAQAGRFALTQALASETAGIEVQTRTVETPADASLKEELQMDLSEFKPGVYTVYITVRDRVSNEISSRFLTLQID
jgi:GWxTD domain-containing protein